MGNEGSCAAVHQRIAYKSASVHMEPVPVVRLGLRQLYFANCWFCSRYWRRDLIRCRWRRRWRWWSRCRQCFIRIIRFSFCLCPPVVRSVDCLPCGWLQTKIRTDCTCQLQTYRWKFRCACHSASLPSSLPVLSGGHVSYTVSFF